MAVHIDQNVRQDGNSRKRWRPQPLDIKPEISSLHVLVDEAAPEQAPICSDSSNDQLSNEISEETLGCGAYTIAGRRPTGLEDRHKASETHTGTKMYSVVDGHGSNRIAQMVADELHKRITSNLDGGSAIAQALASAHNDVDGIILAGSHAGGATSVTALVQKNEIWLANLGDCRAVMGADGVAYQLTTDHTASMDRERQLVEERGGLVIEAGSTHRVQGVLQVTRSIGDRHLKPYVSSTPEITGVSVPNSKAYAHPSVLILASDGVWDVLGPQEALDAATGALEKKGGKQKCKARREEERDDLPSNGSESTGDVNWVGRSQEGLQSSSGTESISHVGVGIASAAEAIVEIARKRGSVDDCTALVLPI